jgi:LacI family transcriptional regulator
MTAHPFKSKINNRGARPTMRDIARLAGDIHPSTVSLALRNSPHISPAMRAKIQAVAKKIGYRRDPLLDAFNRHRLKNLPQRSSRHIAAISDFSSAEELARSPHHAAARLGAMAAAARLHCQLDFFFCGSGQPHPRRLDTVLDARGIRALLLFGVTADSATLAFTWSRTCTVAIDSLQLTTPLYHVTPDYREATRLLWRHVWAQGRRRIAMIRTTTIAANAEERALAGFMLEQFRHPQAASIPLFQHTGERKDQARFKTWLHTHRPEVIIHPSSISSFLSQATTGKNIRCLAYDAMQPDQPGVRPNYGDVGRHAIEQLVTLMQANQLGLPATAACTYVAVNPVE